MNESLKVNDIININGHKYIILDDFTNDYCLQRAE